jgi:hypothetical protein
MQIPYRENLWCVIQLSADRRPELSPPVKGTPQEQEGALFHLLVFRSKIGRDDGSATVHPSFVTGGRAFDALFSSFGRLAEGGSSAVLFSLHDSPDLVNRISILSKWYAI